MGERIKHVAYGYTMYVKGKRERKISSDWLSEDHALKELAKRQQQIRGGQTDRPVDVTFGQAVERYLRF